MARIDQPEHRLSHWVSELCDRIILTDGPAWWTAVDVEEKLVKDTPEARMFRAMKKKVMGIKPGHLDWCVYQTPIYCQIELKVARNRDEAMGKLTNNQRGTFTALARARVPFGLAWDVTSFYGELVRIGFRLHGNAAAIAAECQARYEVAQDTADIKRGTPVKASKPRAPKPSRAAIARSLRHRAAGL